MIKTIISTVIFVILFSACGNNKSDFSNLNENEDRWEEEYIWEEGGFCVDLFCDIKVNSISTFIQFIYAEIQSNADYHDYDCDAGYPCHFGLLSVAQQKEWKQKEAAERAKDEAEEDAKYAHCYKNTSPKGRWECVVSLSMDESW